MHKAYPHHTRRRLESLDGLWDFHFEEDKPLDGIDIAALAFDDKLPVPGAFDACPAYLGKRGTGAYRRALHIEPGATALLEFGAVSFAARVFVDGRLLAEHFCGYTPFNVAVPPSDRSERTLVVLAENRFDFERIPMHEHFFDFYQFGGVIRAVWLHRLPAAHIVSVQVDATDYRGGTITVRGRVSAPGPVTVTVPGTPLAALTTADAGGNFSLDLVIPDPRPWSPETPHLYRLRVDYADDDCLVRFGIREIKTDGPVVLLNGRPLRLFGYNRHEYFPNFGPSTPFAQMVNDVQLLRDLGCNFVRGSHYPQDQRFLDLCDEFGLLFWEENLGWGQKPRQLAHPLYQKHHYLALVEMVERSYNHPCIVIWGFLNEAATDDPASYRPIFEKSKSHLRAHGGNRLVACASNRMKNDRFFEEVDIVCVNFYPGWYGAEDHPDPLSLIPEHFADFLAYLDERGLGQKPFLISEIGCEALYGWRDQQRDFHSEEYQRDYLARACREIVGDPRHLGVCLWHFSDARTYSGGRALGRPRAFNNKGTFDEYRRPKLSRDAVREIFRNRPEAAAPPARTAVFRCHNPPPAKSSPARTERIRSAGRV